MTWFNNSSKAEERTVISLVMMLIIIAILFLMFTVEIPEGNRDMAYLVVGGILGSYTTVIAFWFGSSKGSSDKTDIIKNQVKL
jgi:fluoride ion exporter CrcB/FEX